jgi:hypothetical protein
MTHLRKEGNKRPGRTNSGGRCAIDFVRPIVTIVFSIADPRFHDASLIGALELPGFTRIVAAIDLVRTIDTVVFSVAFPGSRKTVVVG